jgi:hypothetical protein
MLIGVYDNITEKYRVAQKRQKALHGGGFVRLLDFLINKVLSSLNGNGKILQEKPQVLRPQKDVVMRYMYC